MWRRLFSLLLVAVVCAPSVLLMSACGVMTVDGVGAEVNLEGYEMVFFDDFEGLSLNLDLWEYRKSGRRRGGFLHPDQVTVENGNLVITAEYTENKYGEGWYAGMIRTKEEFCGGYFEIRCVCNAADNFWSAFWITTEGVYEHDVSQGGIYGAEIDIFETYKDKDGSRRNRVFSSIHCNGSDEDVENIDSKRIAQAEVKNLCSEYNTFGLMWTEEEYIFYVNGVETGRSAFGSGVSRVPEYILVSLEIPNEIGLEKTEMTKFVVDYVKIYQKKPQ